MKVRLTAAAKSDLEEGSEFYDRRESGAGDYFLMHLRAVVLGLSLTAGIHRKRFKGFHCALAMPRFSYAIYFTISNGEVVVQAILDERRDPKTLRRKLNRRSDD